MSSALHVVRSGIGPRVLFIHGSAADRTTWSIQLATLRERFAMTAYDRRGGEVTVEEHAADAAGLIEAEAGAAAAAGSRGIVVGSSFGAVVALELIRTRPALCAGAVLIEPPIAASDDGGAPAALPAAFLAEYDRRIAADGGPAAAELFLRLVLGEAAYERIPDVFRDRSKAKWAEIRSDTAALIAYRPRYAELRGVDVPVLLLGGSRSSPYFRPTLEALRAHLPAARLEIVAGAGHMLHAEAHRRFAELLAGFAAELAGETAEIGAASSQETK
jgi:pimeloyl-ACP methyl ester carboxylesterase